MLTWLYAFIEAERGEPNGPDTTAMIGGAITVGGFVGGLLCGYVSDSVFAGARIPPILLFTSCTAVCMCLLYAAVCASASDLVLTVLVFVLMVFMLGNYTLLSYTIPPDPPAPFIASAAGIMTAAGYLASGLAGVCMADLIETFGYRGWFISLITAVGLSGGSILLASHYNALEQAKSDADEHVGKGGGDKVDLLGDVRHMRNYGSKGGVLNNDTYARILFSTPGSADMVPVPAITMVRMSGVQDEFMRKRVGSPNFHLWAEKGSVGQRMAWRLKTTAEDAKENTNEGFLKRREKDHTSYFSSTPKEKLSPY